MNNEKEIANGIQKLDMNEEDSISGGYIVHADPEALREMHLDFKPYLVISDKTKKIIDSFDTKEEAEALDYRQLRNVSSIFNKEDIRERIYSNGQGEYMCDVFIE